MATSGISNATAPYNPTSSAGDITQGAMGKEDFLKLLVAQLSHQDPTKPTDPTEFVSQLSQFSSLEQLMNIKSGLDIVAITQTAATSAQMSSFIGKEVAFDSSQVPWTKSSDPVDMTFTLGKAATEVELKIVDADGDVIETRDLGAMNAGDGDFTFDGKKLDGTALRDGTYHITITAKDAAGEPVDVQLRGEGRVTGVSFDGGYPQLVLADGRVLTLSQVLEVHDAPPPTTAPPRDDDDDTKPWIDDPTVIDDATRID